MPELRKTELVRRPLSWNDLCHRFKNLVKQSSKGSFGTTERIDVFLTRSCVQVTVNSCGVVYEETFGSPFRLQKDTISLGTHHFG